MTTWPILPNGMVVIPVYIPFPSNKGMRLFSFIFDTGASCTVINKSRLMNLGYTDEWFKESRLSSTDRKSVV